MLSGTHVLTSYKTAGASNILSGTSLDPIPRDGILLVTAGSDNITATLAVDQPWEKIGSTHIIPLSNANGVPDADISPIWRIPVKAGSKPMITLGGTVSKNLIIVALQ